MKTLNKIESQQVSGGIFLVPAIIFMYEAFLVEMIKDAFKGELHPLGEQANKPTGTRP
jgi:hypothetical protein